jgi:hypothetical protein
MDLLLLILLVAVLCELILMGFLFCIARFYELKFKEVTYHVSFLIPAFVLAAILIVGNFAGFETEADLLITSFCTLIVLMTTGLFLYRKMMGVVR